MKLRSIKRKNTNVIIIFNHLDLVLAGKHNYMRIYNMAKKRTFTYRNNAENPKRARWAHLASASSQSDYRFD